MSAFLLGTGFRADMGTCIRKLVLLKLIDACEDDGTRIFPAMATVAKAAQCSARQVQREIRTFCEVGLLKQVREGGKGRRSTNEYALDLDVLAAISRDGWDAYVAAPLRKAQDEGGVNGAGPAKGDTVSPLEDGVKGDRPVMDRVTPATPKGDNGCHTTPPDSSLEPSTERGARASEREEGQSEPPVSSDRPGSAEFEKRVMRLCNGRGFSAGPWKDWDTSSPGWIAGRFAALSPEERAEAERWRDPYLLDLKDRGKDPVTVGIFLRDRLWQGLDEAILERAEKRKAAALKPDERAKPEGWAAMMGPAGMAWLVGVLLDGPEDAEVAAEGWLSEPKLRAAWPRVWQWQAVLRQKGGAVMAERWHGLKGAMEPVPQGSGVLAEWREVFEARGWPWLVAFDRAEVVYLPKGGPAALEGFADAVREREEAAPRQARDEAGEAEHAARDEVAQ